MDKNAQASERGKNANVMRKMKSGSTKDFQCKLQIHFELMLDKREDAIRA